MRTAIASTFAACLLSLTLTGQEDQAGFFGLERIWDIHLELEKADWTAMFPEEGVERRSMLRMFPSFPYKSGRVTIGDHKLEKVGVRFKGNSTFATTAGTLKRSFKLDFNREVPEQEFLGLTKLNLQCNALDGTQIKEAVSYQLYRDSGVPAGRTCFARVYLTIPGTLERAYLGLYTVVEQVDGRFARRTVGEGLILKPEGESLPYRGDTWNEEYERLYVPKSEVTPAEGATVIKLAQLYTRPDAEFLDGLEALMDVEQFLRYTAVTTILANTDSPLAIPHNYYLIVPSKTSRVTWIPWDLNLSLGGFSSMMGGGGAELSVMKPSRVKVFTRVLETPKYQARYKAIVQELIDGPCSAESMTAVIRRTAKVATSALEQEESRSEAVTDAGEELGGRRSRFGGMRGFGRRRDDVASLETFARNREKSVKDQLAGKSEGRSGGGLFGFGGGNRSRSGFGRSSVKGFQIRDALSGSGAFEPAKESFTEAEVKERIAPAFGAVDTDESGALSREELTASLRRQLQASRGSARVGRFDLAATRAKRAVSDLDTNDDQAVSPTEWEAGILRLLPEWDKNDDQRWDRQELNLAKPKDPGGF